MHFSTDSVLRDTLRRRDVLIRARLGYVDMATRGLMGDNDGMKGR